MSIDDAVGHAAGRSRPTHTTLCSPFVELLPITGASISVIGEAARQSTICATDRTAARVEELQFELGEGPHWDAMRAGRPMLVADVRGPESRGWPMFAEAIADLDVAALFAFPLVMGAVGIGVVDLYRTTTGVLSARDIATARSLAVSVAGPAVRHAVRSADMDAPSEAAMAPEMRREVHQATGMVLVQLDISATEAFSLLRAHAFATGRTVHEVAHDVVTRQIDFSDDQRERE